MAIMGNNGLSYSYDSTELIKELEQDILEFGDELVYGLFEWHDGAKIYKNYLLETKAKPTEKEKGNYKVDLIQASQLLEHLKQQNSII